MRNRLVKRDELARLFRIHVYTLKAWDKTNYLNYDMRLNRVPHYRESAVDAFLKRIHAPFTYDDLHCGHVVFWSSRDNPSTARRGSRATYIPLALAAQQLGNTNRSMLDWASSVSQEGKKRGIMLGGTWFVTQEQVDARKPKLKVYSVKDTAWVLGVQARAVRGLIHSGVLQVDGEGLSVAHDSLRAYVRLRLPEWARDQDEAWIYARQQSKQKLITPSEAARRANLSKTTMQRKVNEAGIAHITTEGKQRRISPEALTRFLESEGRVSVEEVAAWFTVERDEVWRWDAADLLDCTVEEHEHVGELRLLMSCWRGIVQPLLNRQQHAFDWIRGRRSPRRKQLLTADQTATALGVEPEVVIRGALNNILCGIRTPAGDWRFEWFHVRSIGSQEGA